MKREVSLAVLIILFVSLAIGAPPAPPQDSPSMGGSDDTTSDDTDTQQQQQTTTPPPDPAAPGSTQQPTTQDVQELRERINELESQQQTPSLQTTPLWIQLTAISALLIALIAAGLAGYLYYKNSSQHTTHTPPALAQYIKRCRAQGYTDEQIRTVLRRSGYPDKKISSALNT